MRRRLMALAAVLSLVLVACGSEGSEPADDEIRIAVTIGPLADLVAGVVGDAATVGTILPRGADPHGFSPSSRQIATLARADLVVANGLGLEPVLLDILAGLEGDGVRVLLIAPDVDPQPIDPGDPQSPLDPHVWLDPARMERAVELIVAELQAVDAGVDWESRAAGYIEELRSADAAIVEILAAVPADRRKLVTNHESLGYFAARYGFEIVGAVFSGGSTSSEPSSADLANLAAVIEVSDVPAIFVETTAPDTLAVAVAAEGGRQVAIIDLFTGSLGEPGSGADTLIGMLLENARRIAAALA